MTQKISTREWISLLGAAIVGIASLTVYAHSTFNTIKAAHRHEDRVVNRLNLLEEKILENL
jgi:hypothetical protein